MRACVSYRGPYTSFCFPFRRFSIPLDKSRELEIDIYWRDWRSLCAVKFLRLEDFIDDVRHGMALQLEPQGLIFAEIKFLNPMISRKPKLRRQRKIFRQQGKMPRPDQMNINVATWGRLLKRNLNFQRSVPYEAGSGSDSGAAAAKVKHDVAASGGKCLALLYFPLGLDSLLAPELLALT